MADNETNYNEILYNFGIDEGTVFSSHDDNDNLISQYLYQTIKSVSTTKLIHYFDIPIYPTGLYFHVVVETPESFSLESTTYSPRLKDNLKCKIIYTGGYFYIEFFVYCVEEWYSSQDEAFIYKYSVSLGSAVPKTYVFNNSETNSNNILGYHNFIYTAQQADLKAKWYYSKNVSTTYVETVNVTSVTSEDTFNGEALPSGQIKITCPLSIPNGYSVRNQYIGWSGEIYYNSPNLSKSSFISYKLKGRRDYSVEAFYDQLPFFAVLGSTITPNSSLKYIVFTVQGSTYANLRGPLNNTDVAVFSMEVTCYNPGKTQQDKIFGNITGSFNNIIFMDPNLWCFTTRTVDNDQTEADMARYPMYKAADIDGEHQAIYLLNKTDLEGTYDFLSTPGKGYTYQDENKTYEGFTYGYMSNIPEDNKWPVDDGAVNVLSTADDDNLSYYNHTSSAFYASLVSRYGIKGIATKAMIQDSPFAKDQEDNTKWLMEGKDEKTNLLYQNTIYSLNNPYVIAASHGFAILDQFHCLVNDEVYRFPLNWEKGYVKYSNIITDIHQENIATVLSTASWGLFYGCCVQQLHSGEIKIFDPKIVINTSLETTPFYNLMKNETVNINIKFQPKTFKYQVPWQDDISTFFESSLIHYPNHCPGSSFFFAEYNQSDKPRSIPLQIELNCIMWETDLFNPLLQEYTDELYDISKNQSNFNPGSRPDNGHWNRYYDDTPWFSYSKEDKDQFAFFLKTFTYSGAFEYDAYWWGYILLGLQHDGFKINLNFVQDKSYQWVEQNLEDFTSECNYDILDDKYKINIQNNRLYYGDTSLRTVSYTTNFGKFPSIAEIQNLTPPTNYKNIPYNGIPLVPWIRTYNYDIVDSYGGKNLFFMQAEEGDWTGSSRGMDMYIQLFTNDHKTFRTLFVAYPNKKARTYSDSLNVNPINPVVIPLGESYQINKWVTNIKVDQFSDFNLKLSPGFLSNFDIDESTVNIDNTGDYYIISARIFNASVNNQLIFSISSYTDKGE